MQQLRLTAREYRSLAERLRNGEIDALGQVYDAYVAAALLVARHVCADETTAVEKVRSGFLDVWRSQRTLGEQVYEPLLKAVHRRAVWLSARN